MQIGDGKLRFDNFVIPQADDVVYGEGHVDGVFAELADDRRRFVALLNFDQLVVAILGDDSLDFPAVRGLLGELLADFESDGRVFEGGRRLEGVGRIAVVDQLDDGGHRVSDFPRQHADPEGLHVLIEFVGFVELVFDTGELADHFDFWVRRNVIFEGNLV